jgi:hypothetical protein
VSDKAGARSAPESALACPKCNARAASVHDSRPDAHGAVIRRRRHCGGCGHRWRTYELPADALTPAELESLRHISLLRQAERALLYALADQILAAGGVTMGSISLAEQIRCIERELGLRQRVYPRLIKSGRMLEAEAERQMAAMRAVHETLLQLKPAPAPTVDPATTAADVAAALAGDRP